jgi:hypothetical protein
VILTTEDQTRPHPVGPSELAERRLEAGHEYDLRDDASVLSSESAGFTVGHQSNVEDDVVVEGVVVVSVFIPLGGCTMNLYRPAPEHASNRDSRRDEVWTLIRVESAAINDFDHPSVRCIQRGIVKLSACPDVVDDTFGDVGWAGVWLAD